jgi:hypothetical protein
LPLAIAFQKLRIAIASAATSSHGGRPHRRLGLAPPLPPFVPARS